MALESQNTKSNLNETINLESLILSINSILDNNDIFNCISVSKESHEFNVYLLNKKELNRNGLKINWKDVFDIVKEIQNKRNIYSLVKYDILYKKVFSLLINNKNLESLKDNKTSCVKINSFNQEEIDLFNSLLFSDDEITKDETMFVLIKERYLRKALNEFHAFKTFEEQLEYLKGNRISMYEFNNLSNELILERLIKYVKENNVMFITKKNINNKSFLTIKDFKLSKNLCLEMLKQNELNFINLFEYEENFHKILTLDLLCNESSEDTYKEIFINNIKKYQELSIFQSLDKVVEIVLDNNLLSDYINILFVELINNKRRGRNNQRQNIGYRPRYDKQYKDEKEKTLVNRNRKL